MWPRMTHVALWLAVTAVLCSLAWCSSGCSYEVTCSSCTQTPDCMWCGRRGNFTAEGGVSQSRCIQSTDGGASRWRAACGEEDVYESVYVSEDYRSEECNFHGTYQCGECLCDVGYLGEQCECNFYDGLGDSGCRASNTSAVCNGRGSCVCGSCSCSLRENPLEVITGQYCECTNFLCARYNGLLCGGADHGDCVCNKCMCHPGWTGDHCMCEDSDYNCINPVDGRVCSGDGICECNKCKCYEGPDGRAAGKYCEDHPTRKGKCTVFQPCVECGIFRTGQLSQDECFNECSDLVMIAVDTVVAEEGQRLCSFFDEDNCRFKFVYGYNEDSLPEVYVQSTLECPPSTAGHIPPLEASDTHNTTANNSQGSVLHHAYSISELVMFLCGVLLLGLV